MRLERNRQPEQLKREWVTPKVKAMFAGSAEAGGGGPEEDSQEFVPS